jgi:putative ABC transport system ATP-binding protein
MSETKIIDICDMKKIYGMGDSEVAALNGIDIDICEGEFVAIMGPSGSGKSTLMNIIGCLDRPTSGSYKLDGEDVSNMNREELAIIRNQKLGFIFQSYNLLPKMTAVENVMLPMMYMRANPVHPKDRHKRAIEALDQVGLANRANHHPMELSGGQQQRVAIARALINEPVLILADEPTGNLDTKSSYEIMDLLHKLHESGRTIVMVTHEADIARQMSRIVHIRDGKLAKDDQNHHVAEEAKKALRETLAEAADEEEVNELW